MVALQNLSVLQYRCCCAERGSDKRDMDSLLTRPGALVWLLCAILFFAGSYLAGAWERVAADGQRWQLLIDRKIAELEPELLPGDKKRGLYTEILEEYEQTKNTGSDCADVSIRVAGFFNLGFRVALLVSLVLFVIALLRPTEFSTSHPDNEVEASVARLPISCETKEDDPLTVKTQVTHLLETTAFQSRKVCSDMLTHVDFMPFVPAAVSFREAFGDSCQRVAYADDLR